MNGKVGKQAAIAETENIRKLAVHPNLFSTGPSRIYPRILPKPAMPSQMPEIVAMAFFWCLRTYSLPMSQRIIEMTIVAPPSNVLNDVRRNVSKPVC